MGFIVQKFFSTELLSRCLSDVFIVREVGHIKTKEVSRKRGQNMEVS